MLVFTFNIGINVQASLAYILQELRYHPVSYQIYFLRVSHIK